MKKFLFLFLTLLIIGCATTRRTVFFERVTPQPISVLDSLSAAHDLNIPTNHELWNKTYFLGNDSVATTVYVLTEKKDKILYIFSVTQTTGKDEVILKFRQE